MVRRPKGFYGHLHLILIRSTYRLAVKSSSHLNCERRRVAVSEQGAESDITWRRWAGTGVSLGFSGACSQGGNFFKKG